MDEGERMPLVDSDFPEDALPEKSAHMTQVETQTLLFQPAEMFYLHIHASIIGVSRNFIFQPVFNMAEYHQLFIGTERLRCPEILFQPSLTGEDQMGLMETLQYVLAR